MLRSFFTILESAYVSSSLLQIAWLQSCPERARPPYCRSGSRNIHVRSSTHRPDNPQRPSSYGDWPPRASSLSLRAWRRKVCRPSPRPYVLRPTRALSFCSFRIGPGRHSLSARQGQEPCGHRSSRRSPRSPYAGVNLPPPWGDKRRGGKPASTSPRRQYRLAPGGGFPVFQDRRI